MQIWISKTNTRQQERERVKIAPRFLRTSKAPFVLTIFLASVFALAIFIFPQNVFAATQSGETKTSHNGGLGVRHWKVTTDTAKVNSDATSATENEVFELAASGSTTLKMLEDTTGASPPAAADTVTFEVREENDATVTQSFTWSAGDTVSFSPTEAGTYRIFIRAEKAGDYDVDSDTDDNRGYLRAGTTISESNNARSPAAFSDVATSTITLGHTPNKSKSATISFRQTGEVSSSTPSSTTATFTHEDTIDSTFANSSSSVTVRVAFGDSDADWTGVPWTHISDLTGSSFAQVGGSNTTVEKTNAFTADPRLTFSDDGTTANNNASTTHSVYNRGETVDYSFRLLNAHDEQQDDTVTVEVQSDDATPVVEDSQSLSGPLYSSSYAVASGDKATNDATGSPKTLKVSLATVHDTTSNNALSVSSLYFVDAHPQLDSTLVKDDFPNEDDEEDFTGIIASDIFAFFAHVKNVRKDTEIDTTGSAVTITVKEPDNTTRKTFNVDTGADGWTPGSNFSADTPTGDWTLTASTTFNGNSGTDSETPTFATPYAGKYAIDAVGWNQTYSIGDTARFTIQTLKKNSAGDLVAAAADSAPSHRLRYWDGAKWVELASSTMTALSETATYETTYEIPNDSAWIGRKIAVSFSALMTGTQINDTKEIEVVGSPAQVVINDITDTTVPTISASVRITNEGTAAFEYTYEWCVVTSDTNQCGGDDDVAYSSAAKLIQAGANFDTTLTLNVTDTGTYFFKVAVWWSNQSSKASRKFTATSDAGDGGGGGGGGTAQPSPEEEEQPPSFSAVWQKITELFSRLLGIENRVGNLEARVAVLERQITAAPVPVPRREIPVPPRITPRAPPVEAPPSFFRIRLR